MSVSLGFQFLKGKEQLWSVLYMTGVGCIPDLEHKECLVSMYVRWMNIRIHAWMNGWMDKWIDGRYMGE